MMQLPIVGKVHKPAPWIIGVIGASLVLVPSAAYVWSRSTSVELNLEQLTVPVKAESLTLRITASGTVTPEQSVNLSPKTSGLLKQLLVEQGDRVQKGQILARMDNRDFEGQLMQAKAALAQAQANLDELRAGNRAEEIAQAQARLKLAQAQLQELKTGNRPEEITQAKSQVTAAQARVDLTAERVRRFRYLVEEGAEARDRLDEAISDDRSARASLREAQMGLEVAQQGPRIEEIQRAQANVIEAQQAYQLAVKGNRSETIAQAVAAVQEAKGRLRTVTNQLDDTIIRAPFAGIITQKYASEGAFVTPTTSASTTNSATSTSIVALAQNLEVLAKVPEVDIGQIRQGQRVDIKADAYPGDVFQGRVRLVSPEAVVDQNVTSFQVRVTIVTGQSQLRSGMNADLIFLGDTMDNALVVPTVAIATQKGQTGVYVPGEDNKPQFQPITIGSSIQAQTQVLEGLQPGEQVFIDFPPGQKPDADKDKN